MVVVRIEGYDCCAMTHSIWINSNLPKGSRLWCKSLDENEFANDRDPDRLIQYLRKNGFKPADVKTISYGGNY
jgi:hypothetical protein